MNRQEVKSSNIKSIGYSAEQEVLEVEFKNGSLFRYTQVKAIDYRELMKAESVGRRFNQVIKNNHECFKVEVDEEEDESSWVSVEDNQRKDKEFGFGTVNYENTKPISSITFGDGSLCVTDVTVDGYGFSGVSITEGLENRGVGSDMTDLVSGKVGESVTPDIILRFNNPESIDVVISKLELAREHLIDMGRGD